MTISSRSWSEKLDHAGIIYVQQAGRDIGDVVRTVDAHLEARETENRGVHYC